MGTSGLAGSLDTSATSGDVLRHTADVLLGPKLDAAIKRLDLARRLNYTPDLVAGFEQDLAQEATRVADMLRAATEIDRLEAPAPMAPAAVTRYAEDDAGTPGGGGARRPRCASKWKMALERMQEPTAR